MFLAILALFASARAAAAEVDRTEWDTRYAQARADLVAGREERANAAFERLATDAPMSSPKSAARRFREMPTSR